MISGEEERGIGDWMVMQDEIVELGLGESEKTEVSRENSREKRGVVDWKWEEEEG